MQRTHLVAKAVVQLARKRRLLDAEACARLQVLLHAMEVETLAGARELLLRSGVVPAEVASVLLAQLADDDQPPFGPYRPLAHLADGGMGSVWLADPGRDALVVVKTMRGNLAGNAEVRHRFERECRFLMELQHPNVIRCLDSGAGADGTLYMVLDYVFSGDLKDLVQSSGRLGCSMALAIVYQIADVLVAAHAHHLIHRDIKPANIFVSNDGHAKLADFGIARSTTEMRTMLTMEGSLVGSPGYMSPEQVEGDSDLDIRSDIYALGVVLHYCLTGSEPYRGNLPDVLRMHRTAPVPDTRRDRPDCPADLAAVVARCMAKDREHRYRNPVDLCQALVACALQTTASAGTDRTMAMDLSSPTGPMIGKAHGATARPVTQEGRTPAGASTSRPETETGSTGTAGMTSPVVGVPSSPVDRTMAMDLSGTEVPAQAADLTVTVPMDDWSRPGRPVILPDPPLPDPAEIAMGIASDWLVLTRGRRTIMLFARPHLVLGKLIEPPVDIGLRLHPTSTMREACLRISRQHARLEYLPDQRCLVATDLGSGNGTRLDGVTMGANRPMILSADRPYQIEVADVLSLRVAVRLRRDPAPVGRPASSSGDGPSVGLESDAAIDNVLVTRLNNRPELGYAMVLRRFTLGGIGTDLPMPEMSGTIEMVRRCGRWLWRSFEPGCPWSPVRPSAPIGDGTGGWTASPGHYALFEPD